MGLANFSLHLTADRPPVVRVNGQTLDLGHLVGVSLLHQPPSLPQLVLEVTGEMEIEGEGVVMVEAGAGADEVAYLREFLTNLDPDRLDDLALNAYGTDGVTGPGQAFIAALLSMVPTL